MNKNQILNERSGVCLGGVKAAGVGGGEMWPLKIWLPLVYCGGWGCR